MLKRLVVVAAVLAVVGALPAVALSTLAVNASAALNSTSFGLQVNVDSPSADSAFVTSDHPSDETHYLMRMRFKPGPGFTMTQTANANYIRIAQLRRDVGTSNVCMVVFLKRSVANGNYRINVWYRKDTTVFGNAGEFFLTTFGAPVEKQLEFEYTRGNGSNNGRIIARLDGVQQFDTGAVLDNDNYPIGKLDMGYLYSATDTATATGPLYEDEVETYR